MNSAAKRLQAASMLGQTPGASLRQIARATGLSLATVRDVRQRADRGEDPVPARYRKAGTGDVPAEPGPKPKPVNRARSADIKGLLSKLVNDPTLKFNESGRHLVRWLHRYTVDQDSCQSVGAAIPDHWALPIADLARGCAAAWSALAVQLERRHSANDDVDDALRGA